MFRFLGPQNITLGTRTIEISHVDQKIWNEVYCFNFGVVFLKKIQHEMVALGTTSEIDRNDLL